MESRELSRIIEHDAETSSRFLGVLPANQMPTTMPPNTTLIVNCCDEGLEGRHWVALHMDGNGGMDFFDSFGMRPDLYNLTLKLPNWTMLTISRQQLQSNMSNVCGLYCAYFCFKRTRGCRLEEIIAPFTGDYDWNDLFVIDCVNSFYNL